MRVILIVGVLSLATGCGYVQRLWTHYTGDMMTKCTDNGVTYVQSDSGLALLVDRQGNPVPCEP